MDLALAAWLVFVGAIGSLVGARITRLCVYAHGSLARRSDAEIQLDADVKGRTGAFNFSPSHSEDAGPGRAIQFPNAAIPVMARPRMRAWMSWVPS